MIYQATTKSCDEVRAAAALEERERLGGLLHDGVLQSLHVAALELAHLKLDLMAAADLGVDFPALPFAEMLQTSDALERQMRLAVGDLRGWLRQADDLPPASFAAARQPDGNLLGALRWLILHRLRFSLEEGQPVVFSHGWPLSADAWEDQMFFLASRGYRCIAHDRRGHGRSSQPWTGNDLDTYAEDLAKLVEALDLRDAIHVGHSTGGGEVARYIGRHGTGRVAKAVLIGAIPPLMLKTAANPAGTPIEAFDQLRAAVLADRAQFWKDLSLPFYGYNRPGAKISEGVRESFWLQSMMAGFPASYFCIKAFSETDTTEDLKRFDVPTLILHGSDDQIVPIVASADLSSKIVKDCTLKVYPGAPHGLTATHKDQVNADLLDFLR